MAKQTDRGLENREIILGVLTEVLEKGSFVHLVLNQALYKYQYLDKADRAFITRDTGVYASAGRGDQPVFKDKDEQDEATDPEPFKNERLSASLYGPGA